MSKYVRGEDSEKFKGSMGYVEKPKTIPGWRSKEARD